MHDRIFLHVIWTTRNRAPLIDLARARILADQLPVIARQERTRILAMGIVSTHLHLLLRVHPTTSLPRLLQRMKGGTAHHINALPGDRAHPLRWAKGSAVISVSPRTLEQAVTYITSQHTHHPDQAIDGWPTQGPRG